MIQALQITLLNEALSNIEQKISDMEPEMSFLPVEGYTSSERLEAEKAILFRKYPVVVGFSAQLKKAGDYLTHDLTGVPVIVIRGGDGELNAFVNICRHRGTRLIDQPTGNLKKVLVCPYHAWTYNILNGELVNVPGEEGFPEMDCSQFGLYRLPVAEQHGLIFVVPAPTEKPYLDIRAYLGNLMKDLEGFGFQSHVLFNPVNRELPANWKVLQDSSYETYHIRVTHANTIYPMFWDNTGVFDFEEPHLRMVLPKKSISELKEKDPDFWSIRQHANIIYGIFPNTIVLVQPDHALVSSVFPISANRSVIQAGMLIPSKPVTEKEFQHWQKNDFIFWTAIEEDFTMAASIQKSLDSGMLKQIVLGRYEHLIKKFEQTVEKALKGELGFAS